MFGVEKRGKCCPLFCKNFLGIWTLLFCCTNKGMCCRFFWGGAPCSCCPKQGEMLPFVCRFFRRLEYRHLMYKTRGPCCPFFLKIFFNAFFTHYFGVQSSGSAALFCDEFFGGALWQCHCCWKQGNAAHFPAGFFRPCDCRHLEYKKGGMLSIFPEEHVHPLHYVILA